MAGLLWRACLLLLLGTAISQTLIPGRVNHPATKWVNNPIELSANNEGKTGVEITFQFNSESALTAGGAEITFPSGFNVASAGVTVPAGATVGTPVNNVVPVTGLTWLANSDNTITISGIENPAASGGYGPFGITTRHSLNGQIVDCNAVFGSVGIAPTASAISTFQVAYASGSDGTVNRNDQSVEFLFTISQDLWKYDMFVITMSDKFQVESEITCESFVTGNEINYYNSSLGSDGVGVHTLDCSATAISSTLTTTTSDKTPSFNSQKVYVYGNAYDIDVDGLSMSDAKNVKLRVSAIKNPWAVYSNFSWALHTQRFQTNTIMQESNSVSSNLTIISGSIASATYASSWDQPNSALYPGVTAFITASITISNAVYRDTSATITYSDSFNNLFTSGTTGSAQVVSCWMIEYFITTAGTTDVTSCTANAGTVTISGMQYQAAGKQFYFRLLPTFVGVSTSISNVKTMIDGSNEIIDQSTSMPSFDRDSSTIDGLIDASNTGINIEANDVGFQGIGSGSFAGTNGGAANTHALRIAQTLEFDQQARDGASVTISFPFSTSARGTDIWYFGTTNASYQINELTGRPTNQEDACSQPNQENPEAGDWAASNDSYTITPGSSGSRGFIKLTLQTNVFDQDGNTGTPYLAAGSAWCLQITQSSGTDTPSNPQVISNQSTYYELWTEWADAGSGQDKRYITAIQPKIAEKPWGSALLSEAICATSYGGTLIKAAGKLVDAFTSASTAYYVDIETNYGTTADEQRQKDNAFSSGLKAGDGTGNTGNAYPSSVVAPSGIQAPTIEDTSRWSNDDNASVRQYLQASNTDIDSYAFDLTFPIGETTVLSNGSYDPTFKMIGFFFDGADTRVRMEVYYSSSEPVTGASLPFAGVNQFDSGAPAAPSAEESTNNSYGVELSMTFKATAANNDATDMLLLKFPPGTMFVTSTFTSSQTPGAFDNPIEISSTVATFAFPTVYAQISNTVNSNEFGSGGSGELKINNIYTRNSQFTEDNKGVVLYQPSAKVGTGQNCEDAVLNVAWRTVWKLYEDVKEFASCEVSLTEVTQQSPSSTSYTQQVIVVTTADSPEGGFLSLEYATPWQTTSVSVCSISGLPAKSDGTGPNINITSTTVVTVTDYGFTNAATTIKISCTYMKGPTSTSGQSDVVERLYTTDDTTSNNKINEWTTGSDCAGQAQVMVTADSSTAGISSAWSHTITPPNVSQTNANGNLKFKVSQTLPKGSIITIAYPANLSNALGSVSDIKDYCWSTVQYSAVSTSGNSLILTTAVDVETGSEIEIYIDGGFNTPTTTTTSTNGFDVTASWNSITIIDDLSVGYSASSMFTASAAIVSQVTEDSISISVKNAGESSDYAFSWKSSVGYTVGDSILITFPRLYDLFVGNASEWFTEEPNVYYMPCSSNALGASWCTVSKRVVTITGSKPVEATSEIDVTIHDVHNPAAVSGLQFIVSHVGSDGGYTIRDNTFASTQSISSAPNDIIQFKSVSVSDHALFGHGADYTFEFFLAGTDLDVDESLHVTFPSQYELYLADGAASYPCATSYLDTASLTATAVTWNTDTNCATDQTNTVKLDAVSAGQTYTNAYKFTWNISSVSNPEYGETRTSATTGNVDFDDTDFTLFTDYDDWTNKFTLRTYDASDKAYKQRSFDNLNSAYLGFNNQYALLTINDYNAQNMSNRVKVYAGTYTEDIIIRATSDTAQSQMQAKKVVLTGTANPRSRTNPLSNLALTSVEYDFTFFQGYTQITFRIGASSSLSKGLYYIDWATTETGQNSTASTSVLYHHPVRTLVEVVTSGNNSHAFTCSTLGSAAIKGTSTPYLALSTTSSPFSDVSISFSLQAVDDPNISFTPASVTFGPNDLTKYFTIDVSSDYDLSVSLQQQSVVFTAYGTDADVFSMPDPMYFTIQEQAFDQAAGIITSWGQGVCTGTSCDLAPTVSQTGSLWWAISARKQGADDFTDALCQSVESIKLNAAEPNATTLTAEQQANADKIANDYATTETDPAEDETWATFQLRKYKAHLQDVYYGVENIYDVEIAASISATWLWTSTQYQICGYVENIYGSISSYETGLSYSIMYFETTAMDSNSSWIVTASGSTTMSNISTTTVRDIVSYYHGVNPERNTVTSNETNSRRLQSYFMTWSAYLAFDRRVETPTTATMITLATEDKDSLAADLNPSLGTGNSMIDYSTSSYTVTQPEVTWTTAPTLKSASADTVTITFLSDNDYGEVACVAIEGNITNDNIKPTAEQVYLGLDRNNEDAASAKKIDAATTLSGITTKTTEMTLSGLNNKTEYSAFCTASNGYATFPGFVLYTAEDIFTAVTFATELRLPQATMTYEGRTGNDYEFILFFNKPMLIDSELSLSVSLPDEIVDYSLDIVKADEFQYNGYRVTLTITQDVPEGIDVKFTIDGPILDADNAKLENKEFTFELDSKFVVVVNEAVVTAAAAVVYASAGSAAVGVAVSTASAGAGAGAGVGAGTGATSGGTSGAPTSGSSKLA